MKSHVCEVMLSLKKTAKQVFYAACSIPLRKQELPLALKGILLVSY